MAYKSKYTGREIDDLLGEVDKADVEEMKAELKALLASQTWEGEEE